MRLNTLSSNHGVGSAGEPGIAVVADGIGGAFVVWEDSTIGVIRTQRLDVLGNPLWGGGVVSNSPAYQASPSAISDGNGGVVVAWIDGRNGGCDSISQMNCTLHAQHLDARGAMLWGDGWQVSSRASYPAANRFALISDDNGGAYLAWSSGQDYYRCCSMYMQHLDASGRALWAANGQRVTESPDIVTGPGVTGPRLVPDNSGGAILLWWNQQFLDGTKQLTAQRIDPAGKSLWNEAGVPISFAGLGHSNFDAVPDGTGGLIVAIQIDDSMGSGSHVIMQSVSSSGNCLWPTATDVSPQIGKQTSPVLLSDRHGGAYVAWSLGDLTSSNNNRVSVQHIGESGTPLWSNEVQVTVSAKGQLSPHLAADGTGGVVVGWLDCRNAMGVDCAASSDLYVQHIGRDGKVIWNPEGSPVSAAKANQGIDYGLEKRPGFEMINDGFSGWFFVWPDGRNKACSSSPAGSCDLFAQHVSP